jgi:hypothetical protein
LNGTSTKGEIPESVSGRKDAEWNEAGTASGRTIGGPEKPDPKEENAHV